MEVTFHAAERLPIAMVDARALELAIINLLDNAVKYAKDGGRVAVDVDVDPSGRTVIVRVVDGGPGIDEDDQKRIFDRFVRGRNASERQIRGSGIGLALVKHIIESHGGSVRVESPLATGSGSAFVLRLPALAGESSIEASLTSTPGAREAET